MCIAYTNLLKLFVNYLQGRKQRVILDNSSSEYIDVLSGVPQGSILGPLLFILFINDIYMALDNDTNIGFYADDIKFGVTSIPNMIARYFKRI